MTNTSEDTHYLTEYSSGIEKEIYMKNLSKAIIQIGRFTAWKKVELSWGIGPHSYGSRSY